MIRQAPRGENAFPTKIADCHTIAICRILPTDDEPTRSGRITHRVDESRLRKRTSVWITVEFLIGHEHDLLEVIAHTGEHRLVCNPTTRTVYKHVHFRVVARLHERAVWMGVRNGERRGVGLAERFGFGSHTADEILAGERGRRTTRRDNVRCGDRRPLFCGQRCIARVQTDVDMISRARTGATLESEQLSGRDFASIADEDRLHVANDYVSSVIALDVHMVAESAARVFEQMHAGRSRARGVELLILAI